MKLLHIDSSISGKGSASCQLSAAIVAAFRRTMPGLEVIRRDLDANPIPHLDGRRLPTVRPANAPEGATGSLARPSITLKQVPSGWPGGKRAIIASSRGAVSMRRECHLRRTIFKSGICAPFSSSSPSTISRLSGPKVSPSGRSSARQRHGPLWPPFPPLSCGPQRASRRNQS